VTRFPAAYSPAAPATPDNDAHNGATVGRCAAPARTPRCATWPYFGRCSVKLFARWFPGLRQSSIRAGARFGFLPRRPGESPAPGSRSRAPLARAPVRGPDAPGQAGADRRGHVRPPARYCGGLRCSPYTSAVDYIVALIPSVGTGLLFYFVIRAFVNADRNEREAIRRLEEESLRKGAEQAPGA